MAFDLSSVIGQANEVTAQQQSGDGKSKLRLIYPGTGTLKVKLLYNPKSNLVARQIRRHKVGNTNYNCLSVYGIDCPICKTVDSIKNATGNDMWQFNYKTRGISYAQYVGSDNYQWNTQNPEPQVGELILLMYPWTIYQDINRVISTAGIHANELIATNSGRVFNIIRWRENSQEKYKGEIDAFSTYMTFPCNINDPNDIARADAEFEKYLNELPDLNEAVMPSAPNQDSYKYANEASEALSRDYLRGTGYNGMSPTMNQQMQQNIGGTPNIIDDGRGNKFILVNGQYVPIQNNPAPPMQTPPQQYSPSPSVAQSIPQNTPQMNPPVQMNTPQSNPTPSVPMSGDNERMPDCFGNHEDSSPKCLSCLYEIQCITCQK